MGLDNLEQNAEKVGDAADHASDGLGDATSSAATSVGAAAERATDGMGQATDTASERVGDAVGTAQERAHVTPGSPGDTLGSDAYSAPDTDEGDIDEVERRADDLSSGPDRV